MLRNSFTLTHLKETYCAFSFFPSIRFVMYCRLLRIKVKKPKIHANGSSSLPQKILLLECLLSHLAFNSVTSISHICMIYSFSHGRSEAGNTTELTGDMSSAAQVRRV